MLAALSLHSRAVRSSYTQHHGQPRQGTITSVHALRHNTKYSHWPTYDYEVALAESVGTATHTVAHDPTRDFQRFNPADQINVLVDPKRVSYAELPGKPVQSSKWYIGPLIMVGLIVGLAALVVFETVKRGRRRRVAQGATTGG